VNNFIGTLVESSIATKGSIQPRLTGKFEESRDLSGKLPANENVIYADNDIPQPDKWINEKKVHHRSYQQYGDDIEQIRTAATEVKNIVDGSVTNSVSVMPNTEIVPRNTYNDAAKYNTPQTSADPPEPLFSDLINKKENNGKYQGAVVTGEWSESVYPDTSKDLIDTDLTTVRPMREWVLNSSLDPAIFPSETLSHHSGEEQSMIDHRLDKTSLKMQNDAFPDQQLSESTKTVNVHIGRIEVRVFQQAAENKHVAKAQKASGVEEFLNKRNGVHK
jgi:hypothetical protein